MKHIHEWVEVLGTKSYHGHAKKDPLGNTYMEGGGCGNVESYEARCINKPCNVKNKKITIQCCKFTPSKHA